ncbi:acyltransferase [bacterium]|nr:MAG: acyltransferase [bacterium]
MAKAHAGSIHGLRGLAAAGVVAYHTFAMGVKVGFWNVNPALMPWLDQIGTFFVCAFFGISGYLILLTLKRHGNAGRFVRNRIIRIYPLFFVLNTFFFIAGPLAGYEWMGELRNRPGEWMAHYVSNALFLPGVFPLPIAQKNAWSLSFELVFYIVAGLLFFGITGRKWILTALGGLLAAAALWWHALFWFFLIGVVVSHFKDQNALKKIPGGPFDLICLVVAFVLFRLHPSAALLPMLGFFGAIVAERGWVSTLLKGRAWQWLGTVSYSLYLIHSFALGGLRPLAGKLPPDIGRVAFAVLGPTVSVVAAYLAYRLIEVRLTDTLFKPKRKTEAAIS